jgi:hypothetical protein
MPGYPEQIGELIAERVLVLEVDGTEREIVVRLGKPKQEGSDWVCAYQILGFKRKRGLLVYGIDAFQALLLAIKSLSVDLEVEAKRSGGILTFLGEALIDFPKSKGEKGTVEW